MTGRLIVSPEYVDIEGLLIFLAGPIQGADDWQMDAAGIIHRIDPNINIANPRRASAHYVKGDFAPELYNEQVDWETYHLRRAAKKGCIMFWLAAEAQHNCERAYAQTTRFELAESKMHHQADGTPLAVGIQFGYTGAKYIRRRFAQDCPDIILRPTLEETCADAVRLARSVN